MIKGEEIVYSDLPKDIEAVPEISEKMKLNLK